MPERNKFQRYWQQQNRKAIAQHLIIEDIDQQSDLFAVARLKGLIESQCSVKGFYLFIWVDQIARSSQKVGTLFVWLNAFNEVFWEPNLI